MLRLRFHFYFPGTLNTEVDGLALAALLRAQTSAT
jgi:hypothetical protein